MAASVQVSDSWNFNCDEWINAQERQREFLRAFAPMDWTRIKRFILYGGAAGGGKSYIARKGLAKFLIQAHAQFGVKNCRVALFCETFPALKDRHLGKFREEFPLWMGELKDHRDVGLCFMFTERFGNNYIALRNLDDPGKYDSSEFAAMCVDEFTKNKQADLFDQLRKRLRWPTKVSDGGTFPEGFKHPFAALTNPGGPLHGLAKRLWIDKDLPKELQKYASEFAFIPAKATDNKYNPADYYDSLLSLSAALRAAYAEGSWDTFAGQYFGEWRDGYHVVEPFEVPPYWKRIICLDYGWANPNAILFLAVSPDGDVFVYHELYGTGRRPEWWAERILEQAQRDGLQIGEYTCVADPSTFNQEPRWGKAVADMYSEAGVEFMRANNDRINGWSQLHDYLSWDRYEDDDSTLLANLKRRPRLFVLRDHAPNLVRTLPVLISDVNNMEDVDTDTEDHAPDALRYGMMTRPTLTKIPFSALTEEWKEAIRRAKRREQEREK
jgi:phage terminase large subunit